MVANETADATSAIVSSEGGEAEDARYAADLAQRVLEQVVDVDDEDVVEIAVLPLCCIQGVPDFSEVARTTSPSRGA